MKKAWLMLVMGFALFCAGFPAVFDWQRHWWFATFYVAGLAMMIIGRRQRDLVVYRDRESRVAGVEHQLAEHDHDAELPSGQPLPQADL
jgi:hypothetical protein